MRSIGYSVSRVPIQGLLGYSPRESRCPPETVLFAHTHSRTVIYLIHPGNVETGKPKCLGASSHQLDFQRVSARLVKWTVTQSPITTWKRTWAAALNTAIRMGLTGKVAFKWSFGDKKRWWGGGREGGGGTFQAETINAITLMGEVAVFEKEWD